MAFPEYIPTRGVSIGGSMAQESSDPLVVRVKIASTRESLIWDATGYRYESVGSTKSSEPGGEVVFLLPRTDVNGWRNPELNALIDVSAEGSFSHQYNAYVEILSAGLTIRRFHLGPFSVPAGDGIIDLDNTVPASTVSGQMVLIPDLWSELVAQAQEAAAGAEQAIIDSDVFIASKISDPATASGAALSAATGAQVEAEVPPAVSAALADPGTTTIVTDAAEAAIAGADLTAIAHDAIANLEGIRAHVFMHSWGRVRPDIEPVGFISRLGKRFNFDSLKNNRVPGRTSGDIANLILGPSPGADPEVSSSLAWPTYFKRLPLCMATINDLTIFQGSAESTRSYLDAWRTIFTVISALSLRAANSAQVVYSEGWTKITGVTGNDSSTPGATVNSMTGTQFQAVRASSGDPAPYFEVNVDGDGADVIFMSQPAGTASWGTYVATVGATTVGTLALTAARSQMTPVPLRIRGLGPGVHTVRVTLSTAGTMRLDSVRVPHPNPVPIVFVGEPPVIPAVTDWAGYLARLTALKGQIVSAVKPSFPNLHVVDLDRSGWNAATMLQPDGKHPNDIGHAWIAGQIERDLRTIAMNNGLNYLAENTPAYVWPTAPAIPSGGHNGTI